MRKPLTSRNYLVIGFMFVAVVCFLYFFVYKNQFGTSTSTSTVDFTLTDIEQNDENAFNVTVRIIERISEDELKLLALRVKNFVKATSEKGAVIIILPGMELAKEAWATVYFDPQIRVEISKINSLEKPSIDDDR